MDCTCEGELRREGEGRATGGTLAEGRVERRGAAGGSFGELRSSLYSTMGCSALLYLS